MDQQKILDFSERLTKKYCSLVNIASQSTINHPFRVQLQSSLVDFVLAHHDEELQEYARSIIPVELIHTKAQRLIEEQSDLPFNHALTKALLEWFKNDFFKWVDLLPCEKCGSTTQHRGSVAPNKEEILCKVSRTELHACLKCNHMNRFPRINDAKKLLETRRGRCGEWANCFGLVCRAMGLETRYIRDFTDHVWNEIYCDVQNRWIHCDSCENAFDNPHLYESGWGKKLNYVIAIGDYAVKDVTKMYTKDYSEVSKRRNLVSEKDLVLIGREMTYKQRIGLNSGFKAELLQSDLVELEYIFGMRSGPTGTLQGRQSGSIEWREVRGETGTQ